jgi:serine/threonine protein kinase
MRADIPTTSASSVPEPIPPALAGSSEYEVVREISRGGMGVVYLARNRRMDRLEALKVVKPALLERDGALERFEREMRAAARLSHTNIVTAYSSPPLEGLLAFAMEYVEGIDLHQIVGTRGVLPVSNACYYVYQAAQGLQHAHDRKMVHRDIKPNNLMLTRDGKKQVIKILDFGLAKATSENPIDSGLTGEGQMLGTPSYMAPEQIVSATSADIRADIYSLGCTLYYLLTGGPPFKRKASLFEILEAHRSQVAVPVDEIRPDVPVELAGIVARMLHKDPAQRYQQPVEVAQALAPFFQQGVKSIPAGNARFTAPSVPQPAPETGQSPETASSKAAEATHLPPTPSGAPQPNSPSVRRSTAVTEQSGRTRNNVPPKLWIGLAAGVVLLGLAALWAGGGLTAKSKTFREMADVQWQDGPGASRDCGTMVATLDQSIAVPEETLVIDYDSTEESSGDLSRPDDIPAENIETSNPSAAASLTASERTDVDNPRDPVSTELVDDGNDPGAASKQPRVEGAPAPDPLKTARMKYASDVKKAEKTLAGHFDREIEALAKMKMKTDERVHLVESLKAEKAAFEARGLIPWSRPMRPVVLVYLRELMAADTAITKAYDRHIASAIRAKDEAAVASLRQELLSASPRRLLATWNCSGVTFKASWVLRLYSDGTMNNGDRSPAPGDEWKWALDPQLLVLRWRNARDPSVQSVDRCVIAIDGNVFTAENNRKDRFAGKLDR